MKSKLVQYRGVLLSLALVCSGCTKTKHQAALSNGTSENNNVISYCAKEESAENRIYFHYPQLSETETYADLVNAQVRTFVNTEVAQYQEDLSDYLEEWAEDSRSADPDLALFAMDVDYTVTRYDANYFSVTFDGWFYRQYAAHPINYFQSLTIDLEKGEPVVLTDLYDLNTDFVQLVRQKYQEQVRTGLAERVGSSIEDLKVEDAALSDFDDETYVTFLGHADQEDSGYHSFLTDTSLGLSVTLPHAIGDHFEVLIPYEELEVFKK